MTQDQHSAEWMKEAERLLEDYVGACTETAVFNATQQSGMTVRMAKPRRKALLAHLQQRPLPVREGSLVQQDADRYRWLRAHWHKVEAYTDRDSHALILEVNEFGGTLADNARLDAEIDAAMARSPSLPVREEPTAWRVRGYNQFKTSAPGPWRYFDGPTKPRVNIPSDCDFEPLFAPSPSVQNMGEGETGKDGVAIPLAGQRQEGGE